MLVPQVVYSHVLECHVEEGVGQKFALQAVDAVSQLVLM